MPQRTGGHFSGCPISRRHMRLCFVRFGRFVNNEAVVSPILVFSDKRRTKTTIRSRTSGGTQTPVSPRFFLEQSSPPSARPRPRPCSAPSYPRTQSVSAPPPPGGGQCDRGISAG